MSKLRQTVIFERNERILNTAQALLLETDELNLDELCRRLDLAKGTLYKHFGSKDELLLQLLIRFEIHLAINHEIDDDSSARLARWLYVLLTNSRQTALFHQLEEHLANLPLIDGFAELYHIRQERLTVLTAICEQYLQKVPSTLTAKDYLLRLWAMAQGGVLLLNSSFYQRHLGSRSKFIHSLIEDALDLPKLYKVPKTATPPTPKEEDDFSPFGKLNPPTL